MDLAGCLLLYGGLDTAFVARPVTVWCIWKHKVVCWIASLPHAVVCQSLAVDGTPGGSSLHAVSSYSHLPRLLSSGRAEPRHLYASCACHFGLGCVCCAHWRRLLQFICSYVFSCILYPLK